MNSRMMIRKGLTVFIVLAMVEWFVAGVRGQSTAPASEPASAPALEEGWKEYSLGSGGTVTVTVRVRKETSLAQRCWMQLIFRNTGAPLTIMNITGDLRNAEITEPGKDPRTRVDLGPFTFGQDIGFTSSSPYLRGGVSLADISPARYSIERLGGPSPGAVWHVRVPVRLNQISRDVALPGEGVIVEFDWRAPTNEEIQQAGTLMKEVLHKPITRSNDHNFIANVLQIDAIAALLTNDDGVAGLQNFRDLGPGRDALIKILARRKPLDPKIITYLRSAIEKRDGNVVGRELSKPDSLWDDALIEPLVTAVERPSIRGGFTTNQTIWLNALDAHPDGWKANEQITHRLGDAVAAGHWSLPRTGTPLTVDSANLAGMTRDTRYVLRLRPWLDDKTVVFDGNMSALSSRPATLRSCDLAYAAMVKILGEKDEFADERKSGYERRNFDATQKALWEKWDKAIDTLKINIDKNAFRFLIDEVKHEAMK